MGSIKKRFFVKNGGLNRRQAWKPNVIYNQFLKLYITIFKKQTKQQLLPKIYCRQQQSTKRQNWSNMPAQQQMVREQQKWDTHKTRNT